MPATTTHAPRKRHDWRRSGGVWQCARCALARSVTWVLKCNAGSESEAYSRDAIQWTIPADRRVPPCDPAPLSSCLLLEWRERFAGILSNKNGGEPQLLAGKAETRESPEKTAVREGYEEGGVRATDLRLVLITDIGGHRCSVFAGQVASGARLKGSAEGVATWLTRERLLTEGTYREHAAAIFAAYDAAKASSSPSAPEKRMP